MQPAQTKATTKTARIPFLIVKKNMHTNNITIDSTIYACIYICPYRRRFHPDKLADIYVYKLDD